MRGVQRPTGVDEGLSLTAYWRCSTNCTTNPSSPPTNSSGYAVVTLIRWRTDCGAQPHLEYSVSGLEPMVRRNPARATFKSTAKSGIILRLFAKGITVKNTMRSRTPGKARRKTQARFITFGQWPIAGFIDFRPTPCP